MEGLSLIECCSWFIVYSMIGWIYESIYCSVIEKKWINRGFLNGPYCPIYGFGALLDILFLGGFDNIVEIFLLGAILTCSLEYLTSVLMEKLFHARWWDYSDRKFHINGRVCLAGAIVFGLFSVLLIKIVHPFIVWCIGRVPSILLIIIVSIFIVVYIADSIITILAVAKFDRKLEELKRIFEEKRETVTKTVGSYKEGAIERLKSYVPEGVLYKAFSETLNRQHKRLIKSFPKMKSIGHNEILSEIKHFIDSKRK